MISYDFADQSKYYFLNINDEFCYNIQTSYVYGTSIIDIEF